MFKNTGLTVLALFTYFISNSQEVKEELLCTKICCCCCNYDPTPAGVSLSHLHSKGEWMISVQSMFMTMEENLKEGEMISDDEIFLEYLMSPEKMNMNMHMLMGMYGISNKFTGMLMMNYLSSEMSMSMFAAGGHQHGGAANSESGLHIMQSAGIGDVQALILYGLREREHTLFMLSAGISIPVGNIEKKGPLSDLMYPDKRYPYAMQTGSGSVDILPGITYLFQKNKLTASVQTLFNIPADYNDLGYRKGNEMNLNAWIAYRWHSFLSSSFRSQWISTGNMEGRDNQLYVYNEPASNTENYGGNNLHIFLGTQFNYRRVFWKHSRLGVEYGIPVYRDLRGIQMKSKHFFNISLSTSF
jgi:hypothetical protein